MQNRVCLIRALTALLVSPALLIVVVSLNHHPQALLFQTIGVITLIAQISMIFLLCSGRL